MSKILKINSMIAIFGLVLIASACNGQPAAEEDEFNAEATLQAIYSEQTIEAQAAAAEVEETEEEEAPLEAAELPTSAPPEPEATFVPGEPPDPERILEDADSSLRATENRVLSGDAFLNNLFERPFTAREMVYQPELDIYTVDFAYDDTFFYFTITLKGMQLESGAMYGIEFDRRLKGRGDTLVLTTDPGEEWSMQSVIAWEDKNGSVGGLKPTVSEEGFDGNGYDTLIEMGEDRLAFARRSPDDPHAVQLAVSRALLKDPDEFMWGAWADNGLKDVSMFDYNDTMGPGEAGSPFKDSDDYPIKALYSVDNTCRLPYEVEAPALIPGACKNIPPAIGPEGSSTLTCPPGCFLIGDHCECIN